MITALISLGAIVAVVVVSVILGIRTARLQQANDRLDAIKDKKEKDDEVNSLAPADLDVRFDRWRRP